MKRRERRVDMERRRGHRTEEEEDCGGAFWSLMSASAKKEYKRRCVMSERARTDTLNQKQNTVMKLAIMECWGERRRGRR